jgi:hypothetical protein
MVIMTRVRVAVRTGRITDLSAARLTVVATARLTQDHAPPEITRQLAQLLVKGHRLIQVGQEITK